MPRTHKQHINVTLALSPISLSDIVDILSYIAMKLSGFPPNRVIGLGTFLDSCRFQYFIAQKLGISTSTIQALIIGESGPASGKLT